MLSIVPGQSITSDDTSEQSKNFKADAAADDVDDDDDVIEEEVNDDDDGYDDDHEGDMKSTVEEDASSSSIEASAAASSLTMDQPPIIDGTPPDVVVVNPWASLADDAAIKDPTNVDPINHHDHNDPTQQQPSFYTLAAKATKLVKAVVLDEYLRKYVYIMASKNVPDRVKAARTLDLLIDAFEWQQIRCRYDSDDDDVYANDDEYDGDSDDEYDDEYEDN